MPFVVDASATLAWCFRDEATDWSRALLQRVRNGETVRVPAHWSTEVANGLLVASRRKRLDLDEVRAILVDLQLLPILSEATLAPASSERVLNLAIHYNLTLYDAVYLDLAMRLGIPLATLDGDLLKAAIAAGVPLL
jgi:predicted nucleic acid-binding protein